MEKILKKIIVLTIILVSVFVSSKVYSQCPEDVVGWQNVTIVDEYLAAYSYGSVGINYHFDNVNTYDIKVDWSSLQNNISHNIPITNDEYKQIVKKAIIYWLTYFVQQNEICDLQNLPLHFRFYEESECKIIRRCWLKINNEQSLACKDDDWGFIPPSIEHWNFNSYHAVDTEEICGTACCMTDYTVNCIYDEILDRMVPKVVNAVVTNEANTCNETVPDCHSSFPPLNCETNCE